MNEKGQKYGHWEHIDSFAIVYRNTGNYKIVSIAAFNTTTWRQDYDRKDGKMSVRNGMWLGYNIAGKKVQEEDYSDGICKIVKDYDSAGNLTSLTYIDTLGNGKKWTISYRGGRPFAKWPYNGCPCDVVYYPESKLHISNAEFDHEGNFMSDTVWDEMVTLRATDDIEIMGNKQGSRYF
ncbi:hypothetical protein CJD36_012085 [Flavipsychrobacter stenotrophus]|uniref:Uncharacterized protein n=1 Tax=Flavipsychrobacter stenotrophus TaxID=2077091 RepID=A0A2S7SVT1_9BACT|nr:hypothetical protein CJD36_012085 [Flavipsychrobacter stenotrophus]